MTNNNQKLFFFFLFFALLIPNWSYTQDCDSPCDNLVQNPNFDINTNTGFILVQAIANGLVDD